MGVVITIGIALLILYIIHEVKKDAAAAEITRAAQEQLMMNSEMMNAMRKMFNEVNFTPDWETLDRMNNKE